MPPEVIDEEARGLAADRSQKLHQVDSSSACLKI
jgi:hypothetical protein